MIDALNLYTYKAKIIDIVDGDTWDTEIDLGFRFKFTARARMLGSTGGVNTPELHASDPALVLAARAAKARTMELLPIGSMVLIKTELDKLDSFGRILAQIVNAAGQNVGDVLLAEGHAVIWHR
jgi:endonuclease YncB( thermonuclease family)